MGRTKADGADWGIGGLADWADGGGRGGLGDWGTGGLANAAAYTGRTGVDGAESGGWGRMGQSAG